jgi:hypothetical protein
MACFDDAGVQIKIGDVLVGGSIPKKNAGEVVTVQLAPS